MQCAYFAFHGNYHTSNDQKSAKFLAQIGLACLQIGNKSPCLFAYHPQISLPICVSSQISLPICVSSTNLPAYLRIFLPICAKNFACFYSFDQCIETIPLLWLGYRCRPNSFSNAKIPNYY